VFGACIAADVYASDLTVYGSEWIKHTDAFLCMEMYNDESINTNPATLSLRRSKGGSVDSLVAVSNGSLLGKYELQGWDGNSWEKGALWYAAVDEAPGNGDMPGRLVFATSPNGSAAPLIRLSIKNTGYVAVGNHTPAYQLDVSSGIKAGTNMKIVDSLGVNSDPPNPATWRLYVNGYINAQGTVCSYSEELSSSRDYKLHITPVAASGEVSMGAGAGNLNRNGAWDLLDSLSVVDFEYKKTEKRWRMPDGRVVNSYDDATSLITRTENGQTFTELLGPDHLGAKEFTEWVNIGSGEVHRGFIAEDVPDEFTTDHKSVIISDVVANNTAALKEAKRRILELEKTGGGFNTRLAASESARADLANEVQQLATGVIRVEDLKPGTENTALVMQLTESVLRQLGVDPWVEIALADAIETVPETNPVTSVKGVTKYRLNIASRQIEPYTVEESVTEQVPTGKTVERLKAGVRFDEAAGKLYRWVGLASADAAEKLAALRTASQIASLPVSNLASSKLAAR